MHVSNIISNNQYEIFTTFNDGILAYSNHYIQSDLATLGPMLVSEADARDEFTSRYPYEG
jgi:hypothetical protein